MEREDDVLNVAIKTLLTSEDVDTRESAPLTQFFDFLGYPSVINEEFPGQFSLPYIRFSIGEIKDKKAVKSNVIINPPIQNILESFDTQTLRDLLKPYISAKSDVKKDLVYNIIELNRLLRYQILGLNKQSDDNEPPKQQEQKEEQNDQENKIKKISFSRNYQIVKPNPEEDIYNSPITNARVGSYQIINNPPGIHNLGNLMETDEQILIETVRELGISGFRGNKVECIDILWWFTILRQDTGLETKAPILPVIRSDKQLQQINVMSLTDLQNFVRTGFGNKNGKADKADGTTRSFCIFALSTGFLPPETFITTIPFLDINGSDVMRMAQYLYGYFTETNWLSTPYRYLAELEITPNFFNRQIWRITEDTVEEKANMLGMHLPQRLGDFSEEEIDYVRYYLENFHEYQYIYMEKPNTPREASPLEIKNFLRYFDDYKIMSSYNIYIANFKSRDDFLQQIVNELTLLSDHWSYRYKPEKCLSYGHCETADCERIKKALSPRLSPRLSPKSINRRLNLKNKGYRCFTFEELLDLWDDEDVDNIFKKPADLLENKKDNNQNKYFSSGSIRQLLFLLETQNISDEEDQEYKRNRLIDRVNEGLRRLRKGNDFLRYEYRKIGANCQRKIQKYIAALYRFGIYISDNRPKNKEDTTCQNVDNMIDAQRQYQQMLRILEELNVYAVDFLENIPTVKIEGGDMVYQGMPLHDLIVMILTNNICSSVGADLVFSTVEMVYKNIFQMSEEEFLQL